MSMLVGRYANRFLRVCFVQRCILPLSSEVVSSSSEKKKKKAPEIRINLIENTSLTVMSIESAHKLGKKRNVQLTEICKPAHWMLVGNRKAFEFLAPGSKVAARKDDDMKSQGFRGLKHAIFGTSIQEHDVITKIKQLTKWVSSGHVIDVAIDVSDKSNEIRSRIEEAITDAAKLPGTIKRQSNSLLRIQYEPINKPTTEKKKLEKT